MKHEAITSPRVWPELFLYPVYSDVITMRPIRWFDTYSEAVDFVSENLGKVDMFIGIPKRRKRA